MLTTIKYRAKRAIQSLPGSSSVGSVLTRHLYQRPIFVVGVGRSGTSILLQALGEHRQILCAKREVPLFSHVAHVAFQLTLAARAEHIRHCCRVPVEDMLNQLRRMLFEICWGPNYGIQRFLGAWATAPGLMWHKQYWVARTFPDEEAAAGLCKLFPEAKFVYIHRSGVDVVASRMKYKAFRDETFEEQCREWANSANKFRYLTQLDCAITISHAQLVAEREQTFKEIMDFIGLEQDDAPARFAESTILIPSIPAENGGQADIKAVLEKRPPAHLDWSEQQRSIFKAICGDAMREFGYEIPF